MAVNIKDWLLGYYKQRHFDLMSADVRARYDAYKANGDFIGHMKNWSTDLDGHSWQELTEDADLEKLYNLFQDALEDMNANAEDYKDETVSKDYIAKWFGGANPLFEPTQATPEADADILKLYNLIRNPAHKNEISTMLKTNGRLSDEFTIDDLIDGMDPTKKKYNKDTKFRDQMLSVINYVQTYKNYEEYWPQTATIEFDHIHDIDNWFKSRLFEDSAIRTRFKNAYPQMLDSLLTSKKLRDRFANYGTKRTISKQLTKAIADTDYENKDSDDYVPPKVKDEQNLAQRIKEWKEDTYENYLRKFTCSRGSRIYFSTYSQEIIKAIDKLEIKPTAGIDGIISKRSDIEAKLKEKSPNSKKHFVWFADKMAEIKDKKPKAYANALHNGDQMRSVVAEVIRAAIKENKIDEAKTAMEILSVCKYGFTDSKALESINNYFKENKEGIVNNSKLSINKYESVQFVTNAMEKALRGGVKAVAYGIVGVNHAIQKHRMKFRGRKGELADDIAQNDAKRAAERTRGIQIATDARDMAQNKLTGPTGVNHRLAEIAAGTGTKAGLGIDDTNISTTIAAELATRETTREARRTDLETANTDYETANAAYTADMRARIQAAAERSTKITTLNNEITDPTNGLDVQIANWTAEIAGLGTGPEDYARAGILVPQLDEARRLRQEKLDEIANLTAENTAYLVSPDYATDHARQADFTAAEGARATAQADYDIAQNAYTDLETDINEYKSKVTEKSDLQAEVDKQQDIIDHWDEDHPDKIMELMSYWDTLESPLKAHNFRLATTKMRAEMLAKGTYEIRPGKNKEMTAAQWRAFHDFRRYGYRT